MKIKRLVNGIISTAIADRYTDDTTKKVYYNLSHGAKGPTTWRWYAGLSTKHFTAKESQIELSDDNYNLIPIYIDGKSLKDKKGNVCYNIIIDNDPEHKADILLLWSIPTRGYKNIKYSISGNVDIIGEGVSGKSRGPNSVTGPAPVLEIVGDCSLTWTGIDSTGMSVNQTIKYAYYDLKWTIGLIETMETSDEL